MNFFNEDLYDTVLIEPVHKKKADKLKIITGYATSAMAFHHLDSLKEKDIEIDLTVGMIPVSKISKSNHYGFKQLASDFKEKFQCYYISEKPQIHSKIYLWYSNNKPVSAFLGSANYTQMAFRSKKQLEVIAECDPFKAEIYFSEIKKKATICTNESIIERYISDDIITHVTNSTNTESCSLTRATGDKVTVSLLKKDGELHNPGGGLNWGQGYRSGSTRTGNEAYIQLQPEIYKSGFFPLRGIRFTVLTDDGKSFICTRAQKDTKGHAIETPQDNSLLGLYFRDRIGIKRGELLKTSDLITYGRTDVEFIKIDDETFYLDFSV